LNIQKELQRKIISCCDSFLFIRSLPISVDAVVVIVVNIELDMDVELVVIFSLVTGSVKTTVVSEIFE
jgi:hypothetical protein